jgi:hypothetical protein
MTLQTELLLSGSPAIGKGILPGAPATDERGFPSVVDDAINVGATSSAHGSSSMMSIPTAGSSPQGSSKNPAAMPSSVLAPIDNLLEARLTALFGANMNGSGMMSLMQTLDQVMSEEISMLLSFEAQLMNLLLSQTGM